MTRSWTSCPGRSRWESWLSCSVSSSDDSHQAGGWGKCKSENVKVWKCESVKVWKCESVKVKVWTSQAQMTHPNQEAEDRNNVTSKQVYVELLTLRFCNILIYVLLQPDLSIFCLQPTKTKDFLSFLWATFPSNSGTGNINYGSKLSKCHDSMIVTKGKLSGNFSVEVILDLFWFCNSRPQSLLYQRSDLLNLNKCCHL